MIEIRDSRRSDSLDIAKIQVVTWQSCYTGIMPDFYLQSLSPIVQADRWEQTILRSSGTNQKIHVAVENDCPLGYTYCVMIDQGNAVAAAEIRAIYVLPERHREGIGTALLENACQLFQSAKCHTAFLWVAENNISARNFYESNGWQLSRERRCESKLGFPLHEVQYSISLQASTI